MHFLGGTVDGMGKEVRPKLTLDLRLGLLITGCALSLIAQVFILEVCSREPLLCWACELGSKMAIATCILK